jgi:hypothetical protein
MGERAFTKTQYGKEVTRGTAVVATKIWPGTITVPVDRQPVFPEIASGRRARAQAGVINQLLVDGFTLAADPCPFQALPFIFSMGLKGGVTASETTPSQADYLWDHTPSLTAANALNAFTIEFGDDTQAYEIEYSLARSIKIAGKMGENSGVSVEAECFGRQITTTTFTASLAPLAYEFMTANLTKVWIDSTWATLGTTQKTGLLQDFSVEILTGLHPKFLGEGTKYFNTHGEGFIDAMATFTLEGAAAADAIFDAFQAGTKQAIRLQTIGSQIGTGSTYALTINMFGQWESVIPISGEKNGNNLHAAVFHILDDNAATPHSIGVTVTTNGNAV